MTSLEIKKLRKTFISQINRLNCITYRGAIAQAFDIAVDRLNNELNTKDDLEDDTEMKTVLICECGDEFIVPAYLKTRYKHCEKCRRK